MSVIARLVAANVDVLRQAARLLVHVDDELYSRPNEIVFESAIGGHVRHVVDHVECCTAGLVAGRFDYELRRRDPEVERSRAAGLRAIKFATECLATVQAADRSIWIRVRAGDPSGPWALTSCERELEFLHSHTVHHCALIAVLCRLEGIEPESTFGVAPSTIRHRGALPAAPT